MTSNYYGTRYWGTPYYGNAYWGTLSQFACFVAPLSVQADQTLSDTVANINPTAVQIDAAASNATFGNINPTSVQ